MERITNSSDILNLLRNEEPGISMDELRQAVRNSAIKSIGMSGITFISGITILALIGVVLFWTKQSEIVNGRTTAHSASEDPVLTANQAQMVAPPTATLAHRFNQAVTNHISRPDKALAVKCDSTISTSIEIISANRIASNLTTAIPNPIQKLPNVNYQNNRYEQGIGVDRIVPQDYYLSAALQAGPIVNTLDVLGGGFSVSLDHDWWQVLFRYSSTFGPRGNSAELFRNLNNAPHVAYSQDITEYSLQFGMTLHQNDFWATLSGGIERTRAVLSATYPLPDTNLSTSSSLNGTGATVQATFGYKYADNAAIALTGFVSNHTQTYGGILLDLVFDIALPK